MKQIKLYDSNGKIFFKINLNPKFNFLGKHCMFQELKGAIESLNPKQREDLKKFSDSIINDCIDTEYEQQASEQKG